MIDKILDLFDNRTKEELDEEIEEAKRQLAEKKSIEARKAELRKLNNQLRKKRLF